MSAHAHVRMSTVQVDCRVPVCRSQIGTRGFATHRPIIHVHAASIVAAAQGRSLLSAAIPGDALDLEVHVALHALSPDGDGLHVAQGAVVGAELGPLRARVGCLPGGTVPVIGEVGEGDRHCAK